MRFLNRFSSVLRVSPRLLRVSPCNLLNPRLITILQALLVTFLWSTSWVLIKIGLETIPPLTFAGLRYTLAFLLLLPLVWRRGGLTRIRQLSRSEWGWLLLLGLLMITMTQGAQFVALVYLPAVTVSLALNFTSLVVALMGIVWLSERPNGRQWLGIALFLAGVWLYFYPVGLPAAQLVGLIVIAVGVLSNAAAAVVGRSVNRRPESDPLTVTVVSMGAGGALLLLIGATTQGLPALSLNSWLIIGWLALVNTAFAFTLWNKTLRLLTAVESSVINNSMLIQIAILAWLFLGERLTPVEIGALLLAAVGILVVQVAR
jgi:drug/metabolite transporter (DMT)-like permease